MSVGTAVHNTSGVFFITFTCFKWLPLFEITEGYDTVYKWFNYLIEKENKIFAYVIMPNHVHVLLGKKEDGSAISKMVSNGKRFIAYELVKRLTRDERTDILSVLANGVSPSDKKRNKLHQVFEPSFDCKECYSTKFIDQKLSYIHNNPVTGKWNLANLAEEYPHSSANNYANEKFDGTVVTHIQWLEDNNLG